MSERDRRDPPSSRRALSTLAESVPRDTWRGWPRCRSPRPPFSQWQWHVLRLVAPKRATLQSPPELPPQELQPAPTPPGWIASPYSPVPRPYAYRPLSAWSRRRIASNG